MMKLCVLGGLLIVVLCSCSERSWYEAGQSMKYRQCYQISDYRERRDCLHSGAKNFEEYQDARTRSKKE